MATLLQLREQIVIDAGVLGDKDFPITRLNRMINLAQRFVQTQLNISGMKKWETLKPSNPDTTTLASNNYAGYSVKTFTTAFMPDMAESPKSMLQIECGDGVTAGSAREVSPSEFIQLIKNVYLSATLEEPRFMRLANIYYLLPSTITQFQVFYYRVIPDLTTDAGISEIPSQFEKFIIEKVVGDIQAIKGKIRENDNEIENEIQLAYKKFLGKENEKDKSEIIKEVL